MSVMTPETWRRMIREGQERAIARYGHLSADEVRRRGQAGLISRPVAEFLIARSHGIQQGGSASSSS